MAVEVPDSLNWLSFVTGILGFGLTTLNLIALYANFVATLRSAPHEIRDSLGNLRQQLCEEREALRHQTREIRSRSKLRQRISHIGDKISNTEARNALMYAESTIPLHYMTLRDLWYAFKDLERPFLVASGHRAEAIHNGASWVENDLDEKVRGDFERHGEAGSFADWSALYKCDFVHRFIWWQTKDNVKKLGDEVMRVMLRRTEREVTYTRMMVKQMFQGGGTAQVVEGHPKRPGGGGGARQPLSRGFVRVPLRRTPQPRYDQESSSLDQIRDDESRITRWGTENSRENSPAASEQRKSYPRSDAATVGKHHHHRHRHRHQHKRERWGDFQARADRAYESENLAEVSRDGGHRVIEVIPRRDFEHHPQARLNDEEH